MFKKIVDSKELLLILIQKKPFEIFSHFTTALFGDINIFNVFFNYLEPDPYSEYGSGSRKTVYTLYRSNADPDSRFQNQFAIVNHKGAQTKRPKGQNVPRRKVPGTKCPKGQNVPCRVFQNTFCVIRKLASYVR